MQKRLIFILALSGFSPLLAQSFSLTESKIYFRYGFQPEWVLQKPKAQDKNWLALTKKDLPWNLANEKLQNFARKQNPNLPKHHFLQWEDFPAENFTFLFVFSSEKTSWLQKGKPAALLLGSIGHNWEIFLNGTRIARAMYPLDEGKIKTSRYVRDRIFLLNSSLFKESGENVLAIRIVGDPAHLRTGFFRIEPYLVGTPDELKKQADDTIPLILLSLYFFVGLYHLLLFLRRPQEKYNFYFFIFCVFLAVYLFTRSATVFSVMENYIVIARWELFTLFWAISFIIFFIDQILVGYITKFVKAYTAFSISLGLLIWITPLAAQEDVLRIWQASAPIFLVYVLYRVPKATLQEFRSFRVENKRLVESIRLTLLWTVPGNILLGILISVGTATFDILDSVLWHTGIALTKYGFFVFVMGIATALANRFLTVHKQVEELNRTLEQKVEERTRELKETLDRVNALKVKQDGDYYLTSLLIKPLSVTKFNSHWVKGDSFIRQKTHFQFRKWQTEIGGDINIADTIELRGEKYIVFANADAMGKSIQGAGGALVFGVVLNAIIKRTHLVTSAKNVTPEAWLESCFLELQQMFVSFDGSMLISAVVGLVHERSGALYYFNAEHPFPVLVRDQKAEFLHDEMQLRKIGIVEIESMFRVLTFQLKKNDILILGSDGRDDIIIQTEDGAHMNEDETLFLRHVEKANADLNKLYEVIAESGEITDDLSLLKISYLPETDKPIYANESHILSHLQSAKEKWKQNTDFREIGLKEIYKQIMEEGTGAHAFTEVIRFCLSVKKEEAASWALELAERALVEYPTQSELLYLAAVAAVYNGQYKKAIEFGETFRRRDPEHIRNLVNLADAYRKIGQKKRAMNILDKLLEMAPEDELVIKLKKVLTK